MFDNSRTIIEALKLLPRPLLSQLMAWRYRRELRHGERELRFLGNFVATNDLCLDVGANLGTFSYILGRLTGNCIAFEANPLLAGLLAKLRLDGVVVEPIAISDRTSVERFGFPRSRYGHALGRLLPKDFPEGRLDSTDVPVRPIDSYNFQNIRFIKIDVEGHEEAVIRGAERAIAASRPVIMVEVEERHNPGGLRRISDHLSSLAYKGFFLMDGWVDIENFSVQEHQNPALLDGSPHRGDQNYVNNFLFLPNDDLSIREMQK